MTAPVTKSGPRAVATIMIAEEFGWRQVSAGRVDLWVKGYGRIQNADALARKLDAPHATPTLEEISELLLGLDGHFALAASGPGWAVAAVDWVRSIPVAFAEGPDGWIIDDQAERLRARLGAKETNPDAALALAMAGYTIDLSTLFRGIDQLGPGEFVLFTGRRAPQRRRYYCYRPWRGDKPAYDEPRARKALAETTLAIIEDMMKGVGDRILVVPLSAGRDSRLIVSAARHLGYRNIHTFAYGQPGNHEAKTSREIAERLGVPWRFVATNTQLMRRYFTSSIHNDYLAFADTLQSAPFVQDLPQLAALKSEGYVPDDAVLANGNSGDFISGAHISSPMEEFPHGLSRDERRARITATLYKKHFALWSTLCSDANRQNIETQLLGSIRRAGAELGDPADDYGVCEYAEFQDRQCKYVITGQRIYEYLDHEWRLPLWDKAYLDFFESVPLEGKTGQRLYADMLESEDWGGVWKGVPVNKKVLRPNWIRPLRLLAKIAHAPLGRAAWHRFERQYFQYWMELGSQSAIRPYREVRRDRRGARHGVSWLTLAYLESHKLAFGGTPVH